VQVGDLVKFKDMIGSFPGIDGDLAMVVQADDWAIVVEWVNDGGRDDIAYYADQCPFTLPKAWWEVVSESR
jgi:hypothetical protein